MLLYILLASLLKFIGYSIVGWLILTVIMFIFEKLSSSKNKNEIKRLPPDTSIRMLNREGDPDEDEWHTYIAGVKHRNLSGNDIGGFCGYVVNDSENTYDSKAMGVYSGKLLGYIPASELGEYREWCNGEPMPCVGYIYKEKGEWRGRVKILRPCNADFIREEFTRFISWVENNYGPSFVPKEIKWEFDSESVKDSFS